VDDDTTAGRANLVVIYGRDALVFRNLSDAGTAYRTHAR